MGKIEQFVLHDFMLHFQCVEPTMATGKNYSITRSCGWKQIRKIFFYYYNYFDWGATKNNLNRKSGFDEIRCECIQTLTSIYP